MSDTAVEEAAPEEEEFVLEYDEETVSSMKKSELEPVIAEADAETLAQIKESEEAGKARKSVLGLIEDREEELEAEGAAELEFSDAPIEEKHVVITEGFWVRLANAKGVPPNLVGRDAVVVNALVRRAEGGDTISPEPYDYQDGSETFVVRVRDTGEYLSLPRDAFASFDSDVSRLQVPA